MIRGRVRPWVKGDKGCVCLPLKKHILDPKNNDWQLVTCPICGSECWESGLAREALKDENMESACTMCALKKG